MAKLLKKNLFGLTFIVILSFFLCLMIPHETLSAPKEIVKVGFIDTMTGAFGAFGVEGLKNFMLAVEDINKMGGILGRTVEVVVEDDEVKPEITARKARKLVLEDKVVMLHGAASTACNLSFNEMATRLKTIHIHSEGDGIATLKGFSKYNLNLGFFTHEQGPTITLAMKQKYPISEIKRWYIWYEDYAYGHEAAESMRKALKTRFPEAEIVGEDCHPLGEKDFSTRISAALAKNPQVMCNLDWLTDVANFVKQAKPYGFFEKVPIQIAGGTTTDLMVAMGKEMVPCWGLIWAGNPWIPQNRAYFEKYMKRYNEIPKSENACRYYDALFVYKDAVERAKSFDPDKVSKAMTNRKYKGPASGEIYINEFNQVECNGCGLAKYEYDERYGIFTPREVVSPPCDQIKMTREDAIKYGCKWCETLK